MGVVIGLERVDQESHPERRSGGSMLSEKKLGVLYLAGALILTLGIRLYIFANYYTISGDGVRYVTAGRHFWEGRWIEGLASFYPPFFPLMIAAVYPLIGNWELAGQFWPFFLGILIPFPLFAILHRVYGSRVAYTALFFYAVSPYLARFSLDVRSEVPYTFFFLLSFYFLQRGLETVRLLPFLFMGLSSAVAYLIRPEGLGLVIVAILFLLYRVWTAKALRKVYLQAIVLCLGFALFALPYIIYLRWDTGSWLISRKAANVVAIGIGHYDPSLKPVPREESDRVSAIGLISSQPWLYAEKVFLDFFRSWERYFVALHYSYLPFLLAGWYLFFRSRFWEKDDFLFFILIVFYFAVFSLFFPNRRFPMPLVPLSLGWVAVGFLSVKEYLHSRWARKGHALVGFLLVLFCASTLPKTLKAVNGDKFYLREAGVYLKEQRGHPIILSTNGQVAFYAEGANQVFHARPKVFFDLLSEKKPDYLVLDEEFFNTAEVSVRQQGWLLDRKFSRPKEGVYILRRLPQK